MLTSRTKIHERINTQGREPETTGVTLYRVTSSWRKVRNWEFYESLGDKRGEMSVLWLIGNIFKRSRLSTIVLRWVLSLTRGWLPVRFIGGGQRSGRGEKSTSLLTFLISDNSKLLFIRRMVLGTVHRTLSFISVVISVSGAKKNCSRREDEEGPTSGRRRWERRQTQRKTVTITLKVTLRPLSET